jgi:hypothetical protein
MILMLVAGWLVLIGLAQPQSVRSGTSPVRNKTPYIPVLDNIEGELRLSEQEARRSAETKVRDKLVEFFREEGLQLRQPPALARLRPLLETHGKFSPPEPRPQADPIPCMMYQVTAQVRVTDEIRKFMERQDREQQAQERMFALAKVLAGLVVFFIALAGYFRLDEWTKGYYTTWLRVAAVGFVVGLGAALVVAG